MQGISLRQCMNVCYLCVLCYCCYFVLCFVEMFYIPAPNTTDMLPSSSNSDQAIELLWQKLASTEAEATKLSMLLADADSPITHMDIFSSNHNISQFSSADQILKTLSPIAADIPETDAIHNALVSRVCRMESAISLFRATVVRISRERDYWRREKLSTDEHYAREMDAFRTEIERLHKESASKHHSISEAKEKLDRTNEQLRNDLVQTVSSLVCGFHI